MKFWNDYSVGAVLLVVAVSLLGGAVWLLAAYGAYCVVRPLLRRAGRAVTMRTPEQEAVIDKLMHLEHVPREDLRELGCQVAEVIRGLARELERLRGEAR
jgi:hypothetical protein